LMFFEMLLKQKARKPLNLRAFDTF